MPASNRRPLYAPDDLRGGGGTEHGSDALAAATSGGPAPAYAPAAGAAGAALAAPRGPAQDAPDALSPPAPGLLPMQPCTLKGAAAALSAGMLGYMFGFVPGVIRHRGGGWALAHLDGARSAQSFALMSGAYTAVQCLCQRVRQVEDGLNRGLAGCATGLALGWGNGPLGALQSCAGVGGLSYFLDFGGAGAEAPAHAAGLPHGGGGHGGRGRCAGQGSQACEEARPRRRSPARRGGRKGASSGGDGDDSRGSAACSTPWDGGVHDLERRVRGVLALPVVAFLAGCARGAYFDGCGSCLGAGASGTGASGWASSSGGDGSGGSGGSSGSGSPAACVWPPMEGAAGATPRFHDRAAASRSRVRCSVGGA